MRLAVLSDIHYPEHHKKAIDLTLEILPELNLDGILLLGDIVDFEPFSRFEVPPDRRLLLKYGLSVTHRELTRLREAVPNVWIELKNGNHEDHMNRFIIQKAPELYGLDEVSVRGFLKLSDYDIKWIPPHIERRVGKLLFIHGHELKIGSANHAKNLYSKINANVMAGHYHAEGKYIHTLGGSLKQEGAWINSCLRTLRPHWAPYSHWTLGFSIVDFSRGGFFSVEQVLYLKRDRNLWTKVGGKEYIL